MLLRVGCSICLLGTGYKFTLVLATTLFTHIGLLKLAVELEFSDKQAGAAIQWLQSLPADFVVRFQGRPQREPATTPATEEFSEAEQHRLLHKVFGSWKSEEGEEDLLSQLYGSRQDQPREVEE